MAEEEDWTVPHYEFDNRNKTRPGLLHAWRARAGEYWADPWNTYGTLDKNKFSWTWETLTKDPVGLLAGRYVPTEQDIEAKVREMEKTIVARHITSDSGWYSIAGGLMPGKTGGGFTSHNARERSCNKGQGSQPLGDQFQQKLTWEKIMRARNYSKVEVEGEGEKKVERRVNNGMQYFIHKLTLGWVKWHPERQFAGSTMPETSGKIFGWLSMGADGSCAGEPRPVQPVRGPNVRGEYAYGEMRHKNTPQYEYVNKGDLLDEGCGY